MYLDVFLMPFCVAIALGIDLHLFVYLPLKLIRNNPNTLKLYVNNVCVCVILLKV